jgi:hypothetical protein
LKATVSKTVMGHWPIESSNLSLSATQLQAIGDAQFRTPWTRVEDEAALKLLGVGTLH